MTGIRGRAMLAVVLAGGAVAVATLLPGWIVWPFRSDAVGVVAEVLAPWSLSAVQIERMLNVALFLPLGFAGALLLGRRWGMVAAPIGAAVSLGVETLQSRLPGRVPDLDDVLCNTVGAFAGAALAVGILYGVAAIRQVGSATRT